MFRSVVFSLARATHCPCSLLFFSHVCGVWYACAGIFKGRFRILKLPMEFHHETHIDNVFCTCAALHNQVQLYRGIDKMWKNNIDWMGAGGHFGSTHLGPRCYRGGQTQYVVRPESDFSSRGIDVPLMDDEDDSSEFEAWKRLGEELALHYEWQGKRRKLEWPKPLSVVEGRGD